jgi:2-methylcitrate dehydratase PrpD
VNLTETIADYVVGLHYEAIPPEAVLKCKEILLDEIGILLRASKSKGGSETIIHFVSEFGSKGKCTVVGTNLIIDPINAALANGTLGHDIIELDDVHSPSHTHPAAVIVPSVLAVAEYQNAPGRSLITAAVAGYDVEGRIGAAFANQQLIPGFHASCVAGCFGSAVAAAKVLGLNREGVLDSLGSAGSQASGLLAYQDEAMHYNKSLQTGIAARNGVTAALLAKMGYLAPRRILDGRTNILDAFSPGKHNFAELTNELGSRFEVMRTGLKKS